MSGGKLEWSGHTGFDRDVIQLRKLAVGRAAEGMSDVFNFNQYLVIERHEIPQLLEAIRKVFGEEALADNPTVVSAERGR